MTDTQVDTASNAMRHTKLVQAAQQFEAVMMGELMKPLGSGAAIGEDADESSSNPMQSYGVQAMAGALARSGALGFASKMVKAVESHEHKDISQTPKVLSQGADMPEKGD
jgi:Rod binding domain-containing protein